MPIRSPFCQSRRVVTRPWVILLALFGWSAPSELPAQVPPTGATPTTTTGSASPAPTPSAASTPLPAPGPSGQDDGINGLSQGEVQEAINLLRANYIRPADVSDLALAHATLSGVLERLDHGAMLLPKTVNPAAPAGGEQMPAGFLADPLDGHTGYVRLGSLNKDHLASLDKALKNFSDNHFAAVILDLRATGSGSDYELAVEVIRRFVGKGKPLFTLHKPSNNQDRLFTSNGDPAFSGLTLLAVDDNTAGAAETIAAVIRLYNRALVVGSNTPGQAVEYADLRLSGGDLLRVAVSQVLLPANLSIFPGGLKPDVPVSTPRDTLLAIFRQSLEKDGGMGQFVIETERPRFNEAALVSGINPEYDAARDAQAARRRGEPAPRPPLRDLVTQHALDLATSIGVLDTKPPAP